MGANVSRWSVFGKKMVGIGYWLAGALAACSDEPALEQTERVAESAQRLTTDQDRILGFESVGAGSNDWTPTSGVLNASERRIEGSRALAIANGSNSEIVSARLSSLGTVGSKITLDLLLPAQQPNPHWMGTLKLVLECRDLDGFARDDSARHTRRPAHANDLCRVESHG